jgi:type VI secretion system protein ImpC
MPITDSNLEGMFTFESAGRTPLPDEPEFHLLFIGDWSGDGLKKDVEARRVRAIDRDDFDKAMERFGTSVNLPIGDRELRIELRGIESFHPDSLYRELPVFAELRDLRRRLRSTEDFESAAGEVRSWFARPEKAEPPVGVDVGVAGKPSQKSGFSLDDILSGEQSKGAEESELSRLISQVVEPYLVRIDEKEQAALVLAVDGAISSLMRAILHNARFRALEAAWRGLYFAVRRIETNKEVKLYVLDLSKDECVANLKHCNSLADTVIYREAIRERLETPGAEPFSAICVNYEFGVNVDDAAALMRLGRLARGAGAPLIGYVRPEMFGYAYFETLPEASGFGLKEGTDEARLWAAVRSVPEASCIGLAPMRFLARAPYGAQFDEVESFAFEEFEGPAPHELLVWANPSFACAVLLTKSFRAYGWEMGAALLRDLDGLPLYYFEVDGEKRLKPSAECLMTEVIAERLSENGLMTLISFKDSDRIRLARFQSVASPPTGLAGRWNK